MGYTAHNCNVWPHSVDYHALPYRGDYPYSRTSDNIDHKLGFSSSTFYFWHYTVTLSFALSPLCDEDFGKAQFWI